MAHLDEDKLKQRIEDFTWNSRQDLYEYFKDNYQIEKPEVNNAIYKAMESFRFRRGKPIDPRELWQKAGCNLEKRLS